MVRGDILSREPGLASQETSMYTATSLERRRFEQSRVSQRPQARSFASLTHGARACEPDCLVSRSCANSDAAAPGGMALSGSSPSDRRAPGAARRRAPGESGMVPGPKKPSAEELGAGMPIAMPLSPAPPSELGDEVVCVSLSGVCWQQLQV